MIHPPLPALELGEGEKGFGKEKARAEESQEVALNLFKSRSFSHKLLKALSSAPVSVISIFHGSQHVSQFHVRRNEWVNSSAINDLVQLINLLRRRREILIAILRH